MRGFGRSLRPGDVAAYLLRTVVADVSPFWTSWASTRRTWSAIADLSRPGALTASMNWYAADRLNELLLEWFR